MALVHTNDTVSSNVSGDLSLSALAKNLGFETVCVGSLNFLIPGGKGFMVILIGIWVSTLDLSVVGYMCSEGCPSIECVVDGGEENSLANDEGVPLDSCMN